MLSYLALLAFVVFMVGTPGPANLIVMIMGAQFGLRRSAGFILGLVIGKVLLNLFIGFGFCVMLAEAPVWKSAFSYLSAGYMIFLAIRSWPKNGATASATAERRHFSFLNGIVVHPLNPKAWVMSALAWGEFAPALGGFWLQLLLVVLTFAVCQLVLHSLWCWLGEVLGRSFAQSVKLTKLMIITTVAVVLAVILY